MAGTRSILRWSARTLTLAALACCLLPLAVVGPGVGVLGAAAEPSEGNRAGPRVVLIIRHAEKAGEDLSDRGIQRARRLPDLFVTSARRPVSFPTPDAIFAVSYAPRCVQTVKPLAAKLRLPIQTKFQDNAYGLAREIRQNPAYTGKTVLVCWSHRAIPQLARALGAGDANSEWDDSVFDRVWQIRYDDVGQVEFSDLPQRVLQYDAER
jgi:hypothetical protein